MGTVIYLFVLERAFMLLVDLVANHHERFGLELLAVRAAQLGILDPMSELDVSLVTALLDGRQPGLFVVLSSLVHIGD